MSAAHPAPVSRHRLGPLFGYGLLSWAIPFLIAIPFFGPSGVPRIDETVFKSVMLVASGAVGTTLLIRWFKGVDKGYAASGVRVGFSWLILNWALDLLILIPVGDMPVADWFLEIGLRYLMIPIIAIGIGTAADRARESSPQVPGTS